MYNIYKYCQNIYLVTNGPPITYSSCYGSINKKAIIILSHNNNSNNKKRENLHATCIIHMSVCLSASLGRCDTMMPYATMGLGIYTGTPSPPNILPRCITKCSLLQLELLPRMDGLMNFSLKPQKVAEATPHLGGKKSKKSVCVCVCAALRFPPNARKETRNLQQVIINFFCLLFNT